MSEEYEDELVTSHSDENPELGEGNSKGPLAAHSTEGSAVSDLYKQEYSPNPQQVPGHRLKPTETIIYQEDYIPEVN